jgi:thiamine-monophosphate kinase
VSAPGPPAPPTPGSGPALGAGREFDAIRRWIGGDGDLPAEVLVGPGDDAAVLEGGWVVSTDLMVEDVHFRAAWLEPEEVGYRATAAALSDLAAMAARPVGVFVSLAWRRGEETSLDRVQSGVREAARAVGATVLGGDLSSSPGPGFLDVVALGRSDAPVLRSGARPGDVVWVTGALGGAAGAVRAWTAGETPPPSIRLAFARPVPRTDAALWLAGHVPLRALVDLSDGLAGDAGHVAAGSGVAVVLDAEGIPVAEGLADLTGGRAAALELALHGGEDYELCLVTGPDGVDVEAFRTACGVPLVRVGRVEEGDGVWLQTPGAPPERLGSGGFDHLAGGDP